jgi:hypothetical protein
MLTLHYNGVAIGTVKDVATGPKEYIFTLDKDARVAVIKRFVLRELMHGLDYKSVAHKQLAVVIFAAFANPLLRFVERSFARPLWFDLLFREFCAGIDSQGSVVDASHSLRGQS